MTFFSLSGNDFLQIFSFSIKDSPILFKNRMDCGESFYLTYYSCSLAEKSAEKVDFGNPGRLVLVVNST